MFLPTNITLKFGDSGDFVSELQRRLSVVHCFEEAAINGFFDGVTVNGVSQFQSMVGIRADGIAGPETLRRLNGAISGDFATSSHEADAQAKLREQQAAELAMQQQRQQLYAEEQALLAQQQQEQAYHQHMAAQQPEAYAPPQPQTYAPPSQAAYAGPAQPVYAAPAQPAYVPPPPQMQPAQMMEPPPVYAAPPAQQPYTPPPGYVPPSAQVPQQPPTAPAAPTAGDLLAQMLLANQQSAAQAAAPQPPKPAPTAPAQPTQQNHTPPSAQPYAPPAEAYQPPVAATPAEQPRGMVGRAVQYANQVIQKLANYFEEKLPNHVIQEVKEIGQTMAKAGMKEAPIAGAAQEQQRGVDAPGKSQSQGKQIG